MKASEAIFEPITPMNVNKFKGFLKHRREIVKNLKPGDLTSNATCGNSECPLCRGYLEYMKKGRKAF